MVEHGAVRTGKVGVGGAQSTGSSMAQSVVYADLRFAKAPVGCSPPCQASETALCEDEAESPYENVQPGKAPAEQDGQEAQPATGPWYQRRAVPAGLLAGCLLLLATLLTVGLCHWQVTRRLQDTSRAHADERGRLSQQVSLREQSLEQTQLDLEQTRMDLEQTRMELEQARAELQRAWLEGNSSHQALEYRDVELERLSGALGMVQKELQDVQGRLNASESTVRSLHACLQTDCCPSGWVLYKGKCLFISAGSKTWKDSKSDCERQSARLLVQEPWESLELPDFMAAWSAKYWVGGIYPYWRSPIVWLKKSSSEMLYGSFFCERLDSEKIEQSYCSTKLPWICEKAPVLSSTFNTFPRLAKG